MIFSALAFIICCWVSILNSAIVNSVIYLSFRTRAHYHTIKTMVNLYIIVNLRCCRNKFLIFSVACAFIHFIYFPQVIYSFVYLILCALYSQAHTHSRTHWLKHTQAFWAYILYIFTPPTLSPSPSFSLPRFFFHFRFKSMVNWCFYGIDRLTC